MELLKQPLGAPISMADQVITLVAATDRIFSDLPVTEVKSFQGRMLDYIHRIHGDIVNEINDTKALDDMLRQRICEAAREFKAQDKGAES